MKTGFPTESLKEFRNVKIIVAPGAKLVRTGPCRCFKHPNYAVVPIEIFLYPALFGYWTTAFFFGITKVFVLKRRIERENSAPSMCAAN